MDFRDGLGKIARHDWSGDRRTPSQVQQIEGFHLGTVMDDQDEQFMGRVWVYIPGISSKRFDADSMPNTGGTTRDRTEGSLNYDPNLRAGWILCYPMMPMAGSDDFRTGRSPDGRDSREGDVNSYGMWYQPRIGDTVGVLFRDGDSAMGFWIGCIPKQYRNFMMPGASGVPKSEVSSEQEGGLKSITPDDALIPALDRARSVDQSNPEIDLRSPALTFGLNLLLSGMISDEHRGAGTSSARRESPSYVQGWKSPGWVFSSERLNRDSTTGGQFQNREAELSQMDTQGHQFVMDDHPDYQSVRLRTSYGSQVLMDDSGDTPYIYLNTPRGNVWVELGDNGDLNIYTKGSISFHAEEDINLTANRDVNIESLRDINMLSRRNQEVRVDGQAEWSIGANQFGSGGGDLRIQAHGNLDQRIGAGYRLEIDGDKSEQVKGNSRTEVAQDRELSVNGSIRESAGEDHFTFAGGLTSIQADTLFMNSGIIGEDILTTTSPTLPVFGSLKQVPGAPSEDNIRLGQEPGGVDHLSPIVPQHQPWSERASGTRGMNNHVEEDQGSPTVRRGAASSSSTRPLSFTGKKDGVEGRYTGEEYDSDNLGEVPEYSREDAEPGSLNPANQYQVSERMKDFLKKKEGLELTPYKDVGGLWTVGYGHLIQKGDVINGQVVDDAFFRELERTNGKSIRITEGEADSLFDNDLSRFETNVQGRVKENITQGQFDALTSFSYNVGNGAFNRSTMLKRLNEGKFEEVPREWMRWNKVQGRPVRGLTNRRRAELEQFFTS